MECESTEPIGCFLSRLKRCACGLVFYSMAKFLHTDASESLLPLLRRAIIWDAFPIAWYAQYRIGIQSAGWCPWQGRTSVWIRHLYSFLKILECRVYTHLLSRRVGRRLYAILRRHALQFR